MVQRAGHAVPLDEHELQRRVGDREVGVSRAHLGGLGFEQLRVEVDSAVEVGHVQGKLHSGHFFSPDRLIRVNVLEGSMTVNTSCCPSVLAAPLDVADAAVLAQAFAALADPVRLRLLSLVAAADEVCSCDLTEPLGKAQPTVSHHTKALAEAGL